MTHPQGQREDRTPPLQAVFAGVISSNNLHEVINDQNRVLDFGMGRVTDLPGQ